jgi:hypothetical protein
MSLEHEALYFPKTLGIVDVPEGKESLGNITAGLGVLSAAKVSVFVIVFLYVDAAKALCLKKLINVC